MKIKTVHHYTKHDFPPDLFEDPSSPFYQSARESTVVCDEKTEDEFQVHCEEGEAFLFLQPPTGLLGAYARLAQGDWTFDGLARELRELLDKMVLKRSQLVAIMTLNSPNVV